MRAPAGQQKQCSDADRPSLSPAARPLAQDGFRIGHLDLLGEAFAVELEQGIMRRVCGAAQSVHGDDDAVAMIDRGQHRRQDADVCFSSGDDEAVDPPLPHVGREPAVMEGRIDPFVEDHRRWHQLEQLRDDVLPGKIPPAFKVTSPRHLCVFWAIRGP